MSEKKLTVVITTYNRKEPLLEQLKSLEIQGFYEKYDIIVSDNHSDYNVSEWLKTNLSPEFFSIIRIIIRPYNVGGDTNIILSFQLPMTEWMWLLSDDDITDPKSIQTILEDIDRHNIDDVCWIKYSISGPYKAYDNILLDDVQSFFNLHSTEHSPGEMVFMSNNVYRLSFIRNHFVDVCTYNDTCMSQVLLPLIAVKADRKKIAFSSTPLTNYVQGRNSYSLLYAYLRFGNILYVKPFPLNKAEIAAFRRINFFSPMQLVFTLSAEDNRNCRWNFFKKICIAHYRLISLNSLCAYCLYFMMEIIGAQRWGDLRGNSFLRRMFNK